MKQHKRTVPTITKEAEQVIDKIKRGEPLTEEEDNLLLTPQETAALLSVIKGAPVSVPYLSVLVQVGRLTPDSYGGGNSYRYRVSVARKTTFNPRGNPNLKKRQESA